MVGTVQMIGPKLDRERSRTHPTAERASRGLVRDALMPEVPQTAKPRENS